MSTFCTDKEKTKLYNHEQWHVVNTKSNDFIQSPGEKGYKFKGTYTTTRG